MTERKNVSATDEATERYKNAIRRMVVATLQAGQRDGLKADQVEGVLEGLFALGWLAPELRGVLLR